MQLVWSVLEQWTDPSLTWSQIPPFSTVQTGLNSQHQWHQHWTPPCTHHELISHRFHHLRTHEFNPLSTTYFYKLAYPTQCNETQLHRPCRYDQLWPHQRSAQVPHSQSQSLYQLSSALQQCNTRYQDSFSFISSWMMQSLAHQTCQPHHSWLTSQWTNC